MMFLLSTAASHGIRSGNLLIELLGEPDENSFGAPNVAEPIDVLILDHVADERRTASEESGKRIVDILHGEHDTQVAESVHRGATVIGDHRRREESGQFEPAVTVWRTHHGDLDAHVVQSSDAICPVSFDWGATLELETKFGEELNGGIDVFHHDADVVYSLDRHDVSLARRWRIDTPLAGGPLQPLVMRWFIRYRMHCRGPAASDRPVVAERYPSLHSAIPSARLV